MLINLTKGFVTEIDDEDYSIIKNYSWCVDIKKHNGYTINYAIAGTKKPDGKRTTIYMHRLLMNAPKGVLVDHKDRDGLNNHRHNLRLTDKIGNARNQIKKDSIEGRQVTSRYKGVYWSKRDQIYASRITVRGKMIRLGSFQNEVDAAKAYNNKAKEIFGEFAKLNEGI